METVSLVMNVLLIISNIALIAACLRRWRG